MSLRSQLADIARGIVPARQMAQIHAARELRGGEIELGLLPHLLSHGSTFVDIGSNSGAYATHAQTQGARVYAFEAHPEKAGWLMRAFGPSASVLPLAVSDRTGLMSLEVPTRDGADVISRSSLQAGANPGFATRTVEVLAITLDSIGLPAADVIKVDVEGHEFEVVSGARETLRRFRPVCIVECEERHNAGGVGRLVSCLDELGFDGYFVHRGELHGIARFDASKLQDLRKAKDFRSTDRSIDYVNNFLFVHRSDEAGLANLRRGVATLVA